MSEEGGLARLKELIDSVRIGLLTTVDFEGALHTRPLETLRCDVDGTLWFFTDLESPKADELARDTRVSVGYSEPSKKIYAVVTGHGRLLRDRALAEQLWTVAQRAWYPKGVEDEHLSILRVTPQRAEYWETPGRLSYLLAAAAAGVSGEPATLGRSRKLRRR